MMPFLLHTRIDIFEYIDSLHRGNPACTAEHAESRGREMFLLNLCGLCGLCGGRQQS